MIDRCKIACYEVRTLHTAHIACSSRCHKGLSVNFHFAAVSVNSNFAVTVFGKLFGIIIAAVAVFRMSRRVEYIAENIFFRAIAGAFDDCLPNSCRSAYIITGISHISEGNIVSFPFVGFGNAGVFGMDCYYLCCQTVSTADFRAYSFHHEVNGHLFLCAFDWMFFLTVYKLMGDNGRQFIFIVVQEPESADIYGHIVP